MTRVLHVLNCWGTHGGVETFVRGVVRYADRQEFRMDLLAHSDAGEIRDGGVEEAGARLFPIRPPRWPWVYARDFLRHLRAQGPYDVVHAHQRYFSGIVLRLAAHAGVPVRIAHNYDPHIIPKPRGLTRRAMIAMATRWVRRYATVGLSCSRLSAPTLFGPAWRSDPRFRVLYCGLDFAPFHRTVSRSEVRRKLGLPEGAFVVGHVGRFVPVKNHTFLVDIAAEAAKLDPSTIFLLVGGGPLRPAVEEKVARLGLADRVRFAGEVPDASEVMMGAMDAFLFPSLFEGFGLVLLEALAAGLPCVYSDVIPEEADVVKPMMRRLSLAAPASVWAQAILGSRNAAQGVPRAETLATLEGSEFNIIHCVEELEKVYLGQVPAN